MSGTAQATVLAALGAVIRDHGWLVAGNPARLRATLSDVLGPHADAHRGLVDAVVVSAEEGVPAEVRAAGRAGLPDLGPALVARLVDWGMAEDRAQWVVDGWGSLLPDSTMRPTPAPAAPAPASTPPPPVVQPAPQPVAATALPPAQAPYLAPTMLPPTPPQPGAPTPTGQPPRRNRRTIVIAAAVAVALGLGGVATALALTGDDQDRKTTTAAEEPEVPRADGSELFITPAQPDYFGPVAMAGFRDGVALVALSEVPEVTASTGTVYAPPENGKLIGFRLGSWGCNSEFGCRSWQEARLSVEVDGEVRRLPDPNTVDADATYVVAVPEGTASVDLVLTSDDRRQFISLLTGEPASGNIAVLARDERFWRPGKTFKTTERVSIDIDYGDGIGRRSVTRTAEVPEYSLQFWVDRRNTASSVDRALLNINTYYHYPQDENPDETVWYWRSDEVVFRDDQGRVYRPVRMPGDKGSTWYGPRYYFDVPADITGGVLRLGGSIDLTGSNGTPYTATTPVTDVKIRLR